LKQMAVHSSDMIRRLKFLFPLKPAAVLALSAFLIPLFLGFAAFEYSRARKDAFSMMEGEGAVLLDALMASGERSILAYDKLEQAHDAGILQAALTLRLLDDNGALTPRVIRSYLNERRFEGVSILDRRGRILSAVGAEGGAFVPEELNPDSIRALSAGKRKSVLFKILRSDSLHSTVHAAAVRRSRGGVIAVQAGDGDLLALRREVGPGRLMQEIGGRPGVAYVVLQDVLGIRLASRGVEEMSSIGTDPFLSRIFESRTRNSRMVSYADRAVMEIAGAFSEGQSEPSLFRVGLEMDATRRILRNTRRRIFLSSLALVLVGLAGISLYLARQDIRTVADSFRREKTHTGTLLQNLEDAVVAADGTGRITVFNRAAQALFGIPWESVIGKPAGSADFPSASSLLESLRTGKSLSRSRAECTAAGERKTLSISTSVVHGRRGIVDAVILVATDVTGEARLAEQIRRQEKIKAMGEMASGVAHEIRNPINAVGMIAQRFLKEFKPERDEEEYRALAGSMVSEVRRVENIVRRFLEFAKPSPPVLVPLEADRLIAETGTIFGSSASARGIVFSAGRADRAALLADGDQMKQVLLNILANALDATPAGGSITLSGIARPEEYRIEVEDTGTGMSGETRGRIFDLYFTTKSSGMGMGLSIAYRIVQAHGGEIEVESETGNGTLFRVRLPMERLA
jgi:two-component system, NtrC family, sensor histidine kinase HydH